MPLESTIQRGALYIRAVGDQTLEEGLAQLNAGMALAAETLENTGKPVDLVINLTESTESKGTEEIAQIIEYLALHTPPLSGRVALAAPHDLLFGLSRVFSARAAVVGMEAVVYRTPEAAWEWLGR